LDGHVALTGFWWGNVKETDYLADPDVVERIIFRWIFRKWDVGAWTGLIRHRIGTGKHCNEPLGSIK
jgi:hypothetical protein